MESQGASAVISHRVRSGKQQEYDNWLDEIGPVCRSSAGNIDWQIIRPVPNLTFNYTIIIRYDSIENLKNWMESDIRKQLIKKAEPLLEEDDSYHIKSGLEFLFQPGIPAAKPPVRWKQFLVTWSAIYPLSILIPLAVIPLLAWLKIPGNRYLTGFFITGSIVFIMVYFLMPNYTRLIREWLYK